MLQNEYFLTSQQFKMADIKIIQISCDSTSLMSSQKKKKKKSILKSYATFYCHVGLLGISRVREYLYKRAGPAEALRQRRLSP